jgi:dihydroneopterin aldolase
MKRAMTIRIEEITCYGYHGVLPEEQVLGQEFRVSLELALDGAPPAEDQLSETVDYRRAVELVCKIIEGKPRRLLETVAGEIAAALLEIEGVGAVRVAVCKAHPPIPTVKGGVTVELSRRKGN